MTEESHIRINVPVLARVEGEGALELDIHKRKIESLRLRIYEPPRLFEKFLEGRNYHEVLDMVARICGICPVAYQMSAVHALEQAFALQPQAHTRLLRRLFYCGEWIQSHALHIHLLAAPDFLGFDSAVEMAAKYPQEVRRGLRLQAMGNDLIALLGGRSVHPVGACVGGFRRLPLPQENKKMLKKLQAARADAVALLAWTAELDLPDEQQDFCCVSLRHPDEYPLNEGRIVSSHGLDIPIEEYPQHFEEFQVPHSTALYASLHGHDYLVGPLARLNLNLDRLPQPLRQLVASTGISFPSRNMFHSIVARAVEIVFCLDEAMRILQLPMEGLQAHVEVTPAAGTGFGCTEAPRGLLWHRYETDEGGKIVSAVIVPPTSQNQARIEEDLRHSLQAFGLDRDEAALRLHAESVIRNYDPCISCATHFLTLRVKRDA